MSVEERVVECLGGWPVQVTATNCHTVTVNVRLIVDPRPVNTHRRLAEAIERWQSKGEPIPSGLI